MRREPYSPKSTIVTKATERRLLGTKTVSLEAQEKRTLRRVLGLVHEAGGYWVRDARDGYAVMVVGITHSESESAYAHTEDGLSIAIARCNYLANRRTVIDP